MTVSIKVDGVVVWSTSDAIDEVSLRSRAGEAGRVKVDADTTTISIVTAQTDLDASSRAAAPVANADVDQSKANAATCTLNGSASTGTGLTYQWTKVSGTGGTLSDATVASPTYTTHASTDDTTYWLLEVTDNQGRTDSDIVAITVA